MYQYKEKYTLDFTNVNHYFEMHFAIKEALDFPDYYGCNWDALWDCLTDMTGRPINIEILGIERVREKLTDHTVKKMLKIFKEFKHYAQDGENEVKIEAVIKDKRIPIDECRAIYKYKEKYTIDFTGVKDYQHMHLILKESLDFPEHYQSDWSDLLG